MRTIEPDYQKWKRPVFRYDCLDSFMGASAIRNGVHSIDFAGIPVDFLFHGRPAETLLVVFGAAAPRGPGTAPPFYSGIGLSSDLRCSVLCVNDPSFYLDDEIRVAWYTGFRGFNFQQILPPILDKVAALTSARIIMLGGSGGGFASLYYAAKVNLPTLAVAVNPQTNISKYDPPHLRRYARVCFGWQEGQDPESSYSGLIDFDLVSLYRTKPRPLAIYLQNVSDWHVKKHAIPFLQNYGIEWNGSDEVGDGLYLHVGEWGYSHAPAPKPMLHELLVSLCDWDRSWADAITSPDMPAMIRMAESRGGVAEG